MKKALKVCLFIVLILCIVLIGLFVYLNAITSDIKLDEKKLINTENSTIFYDCNGTVFSEQTNGTETIEIKDIPDHVKNAFISIEDKRFYSHNGVDTKGLFRAIFNNLKTMSFKEGASTITQQLIKNTHLSNEKTFKRKIAEIKLAKQLEKKLSKNQILEKYLNSIYFGDNCYGITQASKHYFNKSPKQLTLNEAVSLAGTIKAPAIYSPSVDNGKNFTRKNLVLNEMYKQGYISKIELDENVKKQVETTNEENDFRYDLTYLAKKQLTDFTDSNPYGKGKIHIYTTLNPDIQKELNSIMNEITDDINKSALVTDKNNNILAYYSNCKENYRQMGSTIKPLVVYAPGIQTNTVDSCTIIKDEKTDFNGYSPKNYNDKYYGNISVKESLAKSLNVCSAKIMAMTGVEKSVEYLSKLQIETTENDLNLATSLGATECGATLREICSAYNVFSNNGTFCPSICVKKIEQGNRKKEYDNSKKTQVFTDDTCYIINDMLRQTVKNGTAKKLSFNSYPICAKTGTVGNENGNTDAYCISYTNDFTLGVWCGNKNNTLMNNSVTGGTIPCVKSAEIWDSLYKNKKPTQFEESAKVKKVYIDKISYSTDGTIEIADDNAPQRFKQLELFTENSVQKNKSTRFTTPKIETPEIVVNQKGICIKLCLTEYFEVKIYRAKEDVKQEICDTKNYDNKTEFLDNNFLPDTEYCYYAVPYFIGQNKTFYGEEIYLGKIKTPANSITGENWWDDELN